jgi:NAD(P)-dependent dehydrogenase (short-subunit alcohol dehydrogenase family)
VNEDLARLFTLSGRVALVTGASRGIGHALADGLAAAGARTIGIARSATAAPFRHSVTYLVADVREGVEPMIEDLINRFGALDILVNAAGISLAPEAQPDALLAFDWTLETNLRSAYAVCLAAAKVMRPGSSIINVTSIGAHAGFPDNPGYVAAKGGLRSLTQALAVDLGPRGIRVNALAPGYIHTDMTAASHADPLLHEARRQRTCLGRWGEPDDLVGGCVFLASGASGYMTGQSLIIDGGWTAKGLT